MEDRMVDVCVRKYIMYIEDIADYIREKLGLTPAVNGYGNENTPYEDQVCLIDVDEDIRVIVTRDCISIEKSQHGCIIKPHVTIRFMFPDEISGMSYDEIAEKVIDAINERR